MNNPLIAVVDQMMCRIASFIGNKFVEILIISAMEVGSGSSRAGFGPGFEPNFPKRNRAQSGSIEGTLANNFFSFVHTVKPLFQRHGALFFNPSLIVAFN